MISVEDIRSYDSVLITTNLKEQFEITAHDSGYKIKDTIPPVQELFAEFIHSVKPMKGSFADARPEETVHFDGIAKGYHFSWRREASNELITTKGKIESCTTKIKMANLQFNLQLLEAAGRKFAWSKLGKSFSIKAGTSQYDIELSGQDYFFEGRRLLNILSLYKSKRIAIPELFSTQSEYDAVSGTIYYNHPFIVFTEENEEVKMTFANEPVVACSAVD